MTYFFILLNNINPEYNDIEIIKGASIRDKPYLTIDKQKLNKYPEGLRVFDCGIVNIEEDIDPDEIEEKLEIVDCGVINCSKEQKSAVEILSKDVGMITDSPVDKFKDFLGIFGLLDKDTKVINAANYTM